MHDAAHRKMSHHEAIELLTYQIGAFTAQNDLGSAQMGLEFIEGRFNLPSFMVKGGQFFGRCFPGIQNRGNESIDRFRIGHALQGILDDTDFNGISVVTPIFLCLIDSAQV